MHMHINKSGHNITALRVYGLICFCVDLFRAFCDPVVFHEDIHLLIRSGRRIDHSSVFNQ